MRLEKFLSPLAGFLAVSDDRPVAVFSATWPLARAFGLSGETLCRDLHDLLGEILGDRTLMMPCFTAGFVDGVCNLDHEPSRTGALTEYFRRQPGVRRSVCPFFSFAVRGPDSSEIVALRPRQAWGHGSLYEWMHERDAHIVTLGVHPTHCSYSHYAEWLQRDNLPYRKRKTFSGELVHEKIRYTYETELLVRRGDRELVNDFTWLLEKYLERGMNLSTLEGISVSEFGARAKIDVIVSELERDPNSMLKTREEWQGVESDRHG